MAINTDLNRTPYFDDFDESNQFNRVLFKPAQAVQARELTQLQTILQNQVERFGSNIYKEGTVISGINITERSNLSFVKLKDADNFPDPTIYRPDPQGKFFVVGETSGLKAEIIYAENGFETRAPDLKTFYIKYLNTQQVGNVDVKEFAQGEILSIVDEDDVSVNEPSSATDMVVTVASVTDHVGRSFAVEVNEGIIYQRGHFIFTDQQFIIVSKYTNIPDDISVGFDIEENIITASLDPSLLDNAQGFNNFNAPGADRLQLRPNLAKYDTGSEPEGFFTLIRYERGRAAAIRDVTQFNSVAKEMARRTYEESGNYVVRGMGVSVEKEGNTTYAVVDAGKAYSFGYEVNNIAKKYLELEPSTDTDSKINQSMGVDYGSYYEFVWNTYSGESNNNVIDAFDFDGSRYDLRDASNNVIGSCSVRNVTPGATNSVPGKIHVYAVEKDGSHANTAIAKIGNTPVFTPLNKVNAGPVIFNVGKSNLISANNVVMSRRVKRAISPGNTSVTIDSTPTQQPLTSNIYGVTATNGIISATNVVQGANSVTVTLDSSDAAYIYYDAIDTGVSADDLEELDIFVVSNYDAPNNIGWLGVPNAIKVLSIIDNSGNGEDVTSRFSLVPNQKDGYYDISYLRLKAGETAPANNSLLVNVKVLRRTSTVFNGFLNINSYNNVDLSVVNTYTGKNGITYELPYTFDFRPYVSPWVSYALSASGAETVTPTDTNINSNVVPTLSGFITADIEYYLSRVDSVVIDDTGEFQIVQGGPSDNPTPPVVKNSFTIGEVFIPGNRLEVSGNNGVKVKQKQIKNYTMDDIGKIDRRVDRLSDIVSLSLLETKTKDLFIPDANGLNRFKNGILVDGFKNLDVADLRDPEFSAAIDKGYLVGMPKVKQYPVDMKYDTGTNTNVYSDLITISDTGVLQRLIGQNFATSVRNAVSNFYNYRGKAFIEPQFDSGYNAIQNPAVTIETDLATPLIDLVENLQQFLPLTQTNVSTISNDIVTAGPGGATIITTTTDTTVDTLDLTFETVSGATQPVGTFVTDVAFTPFMQSREVRILVTGLRPNTRHYFYFDQEDVNAHVVPGVINSDDPNTYNVNDVQAASQTGGAIVRSDENGVLAAIFTIPEETFFVGETDLEISDVSLYDSIVSGGTSYSRITYRAYNFNVGQTTLNATTRTADFDTDITTTTNRTVTTRTIPAPRPDNDDNGDPPDPTDPISQTFFVKKGMAQGASFVFVNQIVVYFQTKSETNGITLELREVVNGYPSSEILPFAKKHLTPSEITTSTDSSGATVITFDNPIKLGVEKEYAFALVPDANDPNYLLYTSKVGGNDLITGEAVTQDWGDGVLFTATNNRAWKSYQDEDLKFEVRRLQFVSNTATATFVPNDVESLTVANTTGNFINDELVYAKKTGTSYSGVGISGRVFTVPIESAGFNVGDYVIFEQGDENFLSYVTAASSGSGETTVTVRGNILLNDSTAEEVTATLAVAGRVTHFNSRDPFKIHLKESSARLAAPFAGADTIVGYNSGATADVVSVNDEPISYIQPMIFVDNTIHTSTDAKLMNGDTVERSIPIDQNVYLTGNTRTIPSRSNIVTNISQEDFKIRVDMKNGGRQAVTPTIDEKLSLLNVYEYAITEDETTTSKYVAKEVILQDDMEAVGLKVLLAGYRPPGVNIEVFARFVYKTNPDAKSDWVQLTNTSPGLFSNLSNTRDYREFEYNLDDESNEFSSFQLKFSMRHMTTSEKNDANVTAITDINLFPHIFDFRAIALT